MQYPDFEVDRHGPLDAAEACDLIEEFPPDDVLTAYVIAQTERETCPPVLGFEQPSGAHLELGAFTRGDYTLRYSGPVPVRLPFGLRLRRWREDMINISDKSIAAQAAGLFFGGRDTEILELLRVRKQTRRWNGN